MGACAVIHHRLDLAIRLINAVTGKVIEERNVRFLTQTPGIKAVPRGGGLYLFLNVDSEYVDLDIDVYGYDMRKVNIRLDNKQQGQMRIREVYLLPLENPIRDNVLTLRGNLEGIEEIEAVSLIDVNCCTKEFDARKRIITVLNQRNIRFHHIHYGLINRQRTAYEHFELEKEISLQEIKCKNRLEEEVGINQPIVRVIFGQVNEQGDYVLKVPKDDNAQYLVRFVADGKKIFQKVDFNEEGNFLKMPEVSQEEKEV